MSAKPFIDNDGYVFICIVCKKVKDLSMTSKWFQHKDWDENPPIKTIWTKCSECVIT